MKYGWTRVYNPVNGDTAEVGHTHSISISEAIELMESANPSPNDYRVTIQYQGCCNDPHWVDCWLEYERY